jgi:hypothetical protein
MAFQKAHGLTIAQNGFIENMVVESLSSDPTVVEAGRCWFNETEKLFKFSSLNGGGGVVVRAIKDKEDFDTFVSSINSQASGSSGASVVGYDGQTGANGDLVIGATTVAAALDALVNNVDQALSDIDDITGGGESSIASIQSEVDAVETGVGLDTDGTYIQPTTSNYLNSSTSIANAISTLDTRAKANIDAVNAEAVSRANADDLKVDLAGDTMGGNLSFADTYRITGLAEPVDPADAATKNYVDAFSAGLDPKESSRCATTANISLTGLQTIDGVNVAAGNRVLVRAQTDPVDNGIYVAAADAWARATDFDGTPSNEVSGGSFCFVEEGTAYANMGFVVQWTGNVVIDTDPINWVQFSGAGQIIAGAGIAKTGNEIYLKFGAGIMELPNDEIGIDLRGGGGLFLTEDGTTDSTSTDAEIGIKLDGTTLSLSGSGLRLSDTTIDNLSGLHTELDNTQVGAGLGTGGSYTADGTADYISAATSLKNADSLLDDQLKTVTDGLASEVSNRTSAVSALQTELDATQVGAGLGTGGAWTPPASNYLAGSTSIKTGMSQLDTAIKANEDDIAAETSARALAVSNEVTARSNADTALQTEINAIETSMGSILSSAGAYVALSGTNYINGNATVKEDLTDLDAAIKSVADDLADAVGGGSGTTLTSLQTELDAVETSMGAVIGTDGVYVAFTGKNYINGNADVSEDLTDLDAQLKTVTDGLATEITNRTSAVSGEASTRASADSAEATARSNADTALQTELDATQVGAGLGSDGAYTVDALSNYLKAADFSAASYTASVNSAVRLLDAALKAEETARISGGSAIQTEVDALETALGAVISTAGAYVPHTGKNYINGNTSITADLIDLDAAAKANADAIVAEATARDSQVSFLANSVNSEVNGLVYTFTSSGAAAQHVVNHALADQMVDVTVWVKDDDLKYRNDLVGITITDSNNITIDLTESREIKCIVRSTAAISATGIMS